MEEGLPEAIDDGKVTMNFIIVNQFVILYCFTKMHNEDYGY